MLRAVLWSNIVNSHCPVLVRSIKTIKNVACQKLKVQLSPDT